MVKYAFFAAGIWMVFVLLLNQFFVLLVQLYEFCNLFRIPTLFLNLQLHPILTNCVINLIIYFLK